MALKARGIEATSKTQRESDRNVVWVLSEDHMAAVGPRISLQGTRVSEDSTWLGASVGGLLVGSPWPHMVLYCHGWTEGERREEREREQRIPVTGLELGEVRGPRYIQSTVWLKWKLEAWVGLGWFRTSQTQTIR